MKTGETEMYGKTFEIETSDSQTFWADLQDRRIRIHRTIPSPHGTSQESDEVVLQWDVEVLRSLLTWADQDGAVNAYFTGPIAHQIREHSKELGMTPEMFAWHAVKVFIEVGSGP